MKRTAFTLILVLTTARTYGQEFTENFDDGNFDGWTIDFNFGDGEFAVVDNQFRMNSSGGPAPLLAGQNIFADGTNVANGTLSFLLTPESAETQSGALFRVDPESGNTPKDGYSVGLVPDPFGNSAVLNTIENGEVGFPFLILENVWAPGETYEMEVTFVGTEFDLQVTNVANGEVRGGSATDDSFSSGQIGLFTANSPFADVGPVGARFDEVRLTVIPEPSSLVLFAGALPLVNLLRRTALTTLS